MSTYKVKFISLVVLTTLAGILTPMSISHAFIQKVSDSTPNCYLETADGKVIDLSTICNQQKDTQTRKDSSSDPDPNNITQPIPDAEFIPASDPYPITTPERNF